MESLNTLQQILHANTHAHLPPDALGYLFSQRTDPALPQEQQLPPKIWVILPNEEDIVDWIESIQFFVNETHPVLYYPADDPDTLEGLSPTRTIPQRRILTLEQWYSSNPCIVVSSAFGAMFSSMGKDDLKSVTLTLQIEQDYPLKNLTETLQNMGYLVSRELDSPGMFKHSGDSIQIWCIGDNEPVRLSFFDDELESIHRFIEQTRQAETKIRILPAREFVTNPTQLQKVQSNLVRFVREQQRGRELLRQITGNLQDGIWFPGAEEYLPYAFDLYNPIVDLPPESIFVIDPNTSIQRISDWEHRIQHRWKLLNAEQEPLITKTKRFENVSRLHIHLQSAQHIHIEAEEVHPIFQSVKPYQTAQHAIDPLLLQINRWLKQDFRILFTARSQNRIQRLSAMLQSHGVTHEIVETLRQAKFGQLSISKGTLQEGFIDRHHKQVLLCAEYIFKMSKQVARVPTSLKDAVISSIAEIKPGDIVVHRENGIGQFMGIVQQDVNGTLIDCIQIAYANNVLFAMPVEKIESLYRYRSMGATPKLDKLGSPSWEKRFKSVRHSVGAMAEELLKQMASRSNQVGYAYQNVPQMLNDFSLSFPYHETPDQQQAIDDVLNDLADKMPMNRLIVGDVGFGKTEVALRAAVRVVAEGHQVAILCPTTILAIQHHRTFVERCIDFGIRVALISRLQTEQTKKKLFKKLQQGEIDILIGTHAIFGKDLRFQRLGLVIVDEEHRFGVKHKEALQRLSQLNPECPTEYMAMSATPIPRTLHLAMSGLREVSIIATPPPGRISIQTRFLRFNIQEIAKQIRFELQRGGQIFFVHNVVKELNGIAQMLQKELPNIQIEVASGQHNKKHLEQVMMNIWEGKTHVLVCTTIVENGIDLPNVNTIFINNAHNMGLAQLYQLRGRVGRGKEQGYCTLLIPEAGLSTDALSRMTALKQYTALGSGFAIANADLEIRGSGDLLGKDQSGHIDAIGLDIYIDLLQEAIQELKQSTELSYVPQVSIPVTAAIPTEYIADMQDRLQSYRQMATAQAVEELHGLLDLWEYTFGPPPQMAINAMGLAEIRLLAKQIGIERIDWLKSNVRFISHPSCEIPWKDVEKLCSQHPRLEFVYLQQGIWKFSSKTSYEEGQNPIPFVIQLLVMLQALQTA